MAATMRGYEMEANTATIYLNGQAGTTYCKSCCSRQWKCTLNIGYDTVGTVAYQYQGNIANLLK